jgi:hypothetical protein
MPSVGSSLFLDPPGFAIVPLSTHWLMFYFLPASRSIVNSGCFKGWLVG